LPHFKREVTGHLFYCWPERAYAFSPLP